MVIDVSYGIRGGLSRVWAGPADRLRHAMAISGTAASGLIAAFGTMSKPLQLGRAAADGLMAALLAREDFTGPEELLEGDPGFGRPFVGEAIRDWSRIGTELKRMRATMLLAEVHAQLGHGEGYQYPHDQPEGWVAQQYLPDAQRSQRFYEPHDPWFPHHPTSTRQP